MAKSLSSAFIWLFALVLTCNLRSAVAQVVLLKDSNKSYAVNYPLFLIDDNEGLKAKEVLLNTNFKPAQLPILSLGATNATVWIKTRIINQSQHKDWHLQIDSPPVLKTVEVYQKQANGLVKIFSAQDDEPKNAAQVKVNNLLIPVIIPQNTEVEYYIRANSNNILRIPLKIVRLQTSFEQGYLTDLLNGITFGMLMAFALYNLFVYILTKEQPYLYYLGYIFFWGLNLFFYNGFIPHVFSSAIWLNNAGLILAFAGLFSVLFTNSFLKTRINSPFFYQIRWPMCCLLLIVLCAAVFLEGAYSFILVQYLMYPFFIYWLGAGIQSLKNGYKPALYLILGFGSLMLGSAIYNLKDLDILPDNVFTRSSMHWGTIMDALILSFALANRLSFYQKEKEQIELKFIKEKRKYLKELLRRQEQEKKRVAMELHDNIGQQLILIKNKYWRLQRVSQGTLKNAVTRSIDQVAEIMVEIRSMLHRLRPYQMDLLGLTASIHGMISETFTSSDSDARRKDDINQLFNANESMHIFRIIQLMTDELLANYGAIEMSYQIKRLESTVNFEFYFSPQQLHLSNLNDINNRLELLDGELSLETISTGTVIRLNIPYTIVSHSGN